MSLLNQHAYKVVRMMRVGASRRRVSALPQTRPHDILYPPHRPVEPGLPLFVFDTIDYAREWQSESNFTYPDFELWKVMTTTLSDPPARLPIDSSHFHFFWIDPAAFWSIHAHELSWEPPPGTKITRSLVLVERVIDGWRMREVESSEDESGEPDLPASVHAQTGCQQTLPDQ